MGAGSCSEVSSSQRSGQSPGTETNSGARSQRLFWKVMRDCRHLRDRGMRYLPAAVTGLAEGHIFSFLAVHAKAGLGWLLTVI